MTVLSETILYRLLDASDTGLIGIAPDGSIALWNGWMESRSNRRRQSVLGRRLDEVFPAAGGGRVFEAVEQALADGLSSLLPQPPNGTLLPLYRDTGPGGEPEPIQQNVIVKALSTDDGKHFCFIQVTDITLVASREQLLRDQSRQMTELAEKCSAKERQVRAILNNALDGILTFDEKHRIETANRAAEAMFGYSSGGLVGKLANDIIGSRSGDTGITDLFGALEGSVKEANGRECVGRRQNDTTFPVEFSLGVTHLDGKKLYIATVRNISERKEAEHVIWRQANYDTLTGLPNRALFTDRLLQGMSRADREGDKLALMFVDLDHFKRVNDTLGHSVGDKLLVEAASRLKECLRKNDTVARLGGDEFTVILHGISKPQQCELVGLKILEYLAKPFHLDGDETFVSGSIGITLYPDDGRDIETLLRNADNAMYKAKEAGRNSLHFFTQQMHEQVHKRIAIEADLRQALPRNQMFLHYQPIVDATTLAVSGVEALLRWDHPGRGMVAPNDFISVAEETGLIVPIGEWVLRTACDQAKAWLDDGLLPGRIAVNVSSRQCRHGSWLEFIEWVLRDSGLPPDLLTIEITESVLLDGMDFRVAMCVLQDMGVHLSIDDFGTGYSSLSYLKQFPADVVKIDRTFVSDVVNDPDSAALTQAIVAMAHGLKLKTVAEGVENVEQVEFLRALGCDYLQGFYFSRPQPADAIEAYFRRNRSAPSEDSQTA